MSNVEIPTTDLYLHTVIARTDCPTHDADINMFCYFAPGLVLEPVLGICNSRAKRAGFIGYISPASLKPTTARTGNGTKR